MAKLDPKALLHSLRWEADQLVCNHDGDWVWLKPCLQNGKRIGITDCCFADDPCERHRQQHAEHLPDKPKEVT